MTVYVDDVRHELLVMADRIGVARKWIQGHPVLSFGKHRQASWVHFDVSLGCKAKALAAGAVLTDRYGPLIHKSSLQCADALDRGDLVAAERYARMVHMAEACRSRV